MENLGKTIRIFRNAKEFFFCITQDHLEGIKSTKEEIKSAKELGMATYFKLYDDDDVLYYSGYYNEETLDEEMEVLDWGMADSGCTRMDVRNPQTGKMEML